MSVWKTHARAVAFVMAGVASGSAAAQTLAGSEWRPSAIGAGDVPAELESFVRFGDDGKLVGNGGCNNFFGGYAEAGETIAIGPLGATRMDCGDAVRDVEQGLFKALARARRFQRDGTRLRLIDCAGTPVAEFVQVDAD